MASWRRTVVQSAQGTPPFSGSNSQREAEKRRKMDKGSRGCGGGVSGDWQQPMCSGLADNVAANTVHCPSSMAVCPAPLSVMILERLVRRNACACRHTCVCVCVWLRDAKLAVPAINLSLVSSRSDRFTRHASRPHVAALIMIYVRVPHRDSCSPRIISVADKSCSMRFRIA